MTARAKGKPASLTDAFYTNPSPTAAIDLAIGDHEAHCAPGSPSYEFTHQLRIARDQAGAWLCLTTSPRFQRMTVAEAVAEMRANGVAP